MGEVWVQHVLQLGCSPSFVKDTGCTGNMEPTLIVSVKSFSVLFQAVEACAGL